MSNETLLIFDAQCLPEYISANEAYINILSDISKEEAKHRIWLVLWRHPEYTGDIIISFNSENKTFLWNSEDLR